MRVETTRGLAIGRGHSRRRRWDSLASVGSAWVARVCITSCRCCYAIWGRLHSTPLCIANAFQGYQVALNSLVGHVLDLCLSHHDQLRNNAVNILYSMIVSEFHLSEHFNDIETELVNKLDSLFMSESKSDDISRAFFISQLRSLFESSDVDDQLRQRVSDFLDSVDLFLELLMNVRELPEGDEFQDDRVIATLRLMNFIRRIGRDEIYIKYVHQLVNVSALPFVSRHPLISLRCISKAKTTSKLRSLSSSMQICTTGTSIHSCRQWQISTCPNNLTLSARRLFAYSFWTISVRQCQF